uniref:RRM domain-containing protein n=1 Tax=Pseudo-nitzschia australis TaxID=44445 RepID=A0A7S4EJL3_9STRA
MASLANVEHRNQEATVYVGNLDAVCTEKILLELFAQVGRVKSVYMPTDKITNTHNGYGFIEFLDTRDADYAIQILNMMKFYNRPLKVNKSSVNNSKTEMWSKDVGANLFVGNLDPIDVDEHLLYDTFGAFGTLIKQPKIMREEDTGESKGFGFVSYDSFEASDTALECMSGQYLGNRQIVVQYAFKKDTGIGGNNLGSTNSSSSTNHSHERHGSRAERMLAAQRKSQQDQLQQSSSLNNVTINRGNNAISNNSSISSSAVNRMMPPPPPPPVMRGGMGVGAGAARGFGGSTPGHYGPPPGGGGYYQSQQNGMMPPPPPPPMMGMNMGGGGMSMSMPPPPPPPPPPMMQSG